VKLNHQFRLEASLVFPHGRKKMDGGKKVKFEADAEYLQCAGLFSEDRYDEEWVRCQKMSKVGTHFCGN
jgi:hypothetical protein